MDTIRRASFSGLLVLALSAPAFAGVGDSPLPTLGGKKSKHVFTVPGVVSNAALATAITCTSLEKSKDLRLAVQYFFATGGNPEIVGPTSTLLAPGHTTVWSTQETTLSEILAALSDSPFSRSARVVATSTKLACTAAVLERAADGTVPAASWDLTVIKKTSQKGD